MLAFWKQRLVLLAVPKTGTTALEQALAQTASLAVLDPPGLKHISARRYRAEVEPWLTRGGAEPHETLAVIREPIDWLGSWYRYRMRPQLRGAPASTEGMDFDDFVKAWMQPDPPVYARVGSQARFLTGGRGRRLVTHLYRYEDYDRLVAFLQDRLDQLISPERVNVSPRLGLVLSNEVEEALRHHAARDFALWEAAADG